ncbi:DUF5623 domain-containing protein [Stagnihabitans tardus]|uniref:DUF5623 domain-containing protein n=1 Tax=Stagnihabitans tardus TaxID=2699202 RepID=A0AAE4YC32_9RHOB|nr:DUF5623 domain-containing protein [Stagnihabitans tardus]NBZ89229.1 hypothetical protein [Stagnihabitans tardus]
MVAEDHFVCDSIAPSQDYARAGLCTAARSLQFIEATGLLPDRNPRKLEPRSLSGEILPGRDHATFWVDPSNGQRFFIDEPYESRALEAERTAWADCHGWRVEKASWPGIYRPYECDLYVAVDGRSGSDIDSLLRSVNSMADPSITENWDGESTASWETFVSPMATTAQAKRRAKCKGMIYPEASLKTVPYNFARGTSQRRPIGELGIKGHIEAGRIIKAAIGSEFAPAAGYMRLGSLRADLEDWFCLEIGPEQRQRPEFFQVYYGETDEDKAFRQTLRTRADLIAWLQSLKGKLLEAYPDCAPLRRQLGRIEMAMSMIEKANASVPGAP